MSAQSHLASNAEMRGGNSSVHYERVQYTPDTTDMESVAAYLISV